MERLLLKDKTMTWTELRSLLLKNRDEDGVVLDPIIRDCVFIDLLEGDEWIMNFKREFYLDVFGFEFFKKEIEMNLIAGVPVFGGFITGCIFK